MALLVILVFAWITYNNLKTGSARAGKGLGHAYRKDGLLFFWSAIVSQWLLCAVILIMMWLGAAHQCWIGQ
jgi:hypothetical protein